MAKATIPKEIQDEVVKKIDAYNQKNYSHRSDNLAYFAEFKGKFLYLKRKEHDQISPIARMKYTGNMKEWEFAIFKWSRETYDPDEFMFPGSELLDGTIEGAMNAGMKAYPI
jgi:hypothetical protein